MMDSGSKRSPDEDAPRRDEKRQKTKKQWRVPRQSKGAMTQPRTIQPGDCGIWATCNKGRERKCVGELRDLFAEYADLMYEEVKMVATDEDAGAGIDEATAGIENEIQSEIAELHRPQRKQLFTSLRVEVQCVIFMKTQSPVEPVKFVQRICEDAMKNASQKQTRFVKRLTPMTLLGRASTEGLEMVAREVLAPHFHQQPFQPRKFAIRPSLRNHNSITRDSVIKQIASIVGSGHEVNLKEYDLLILVEVYQNVCGVSVVDASFERLKRFNLAEIYAPTQPTHAAQVEGEGQSLAPSSQPDNAVKPGSDAVTRAMTIDDVPCT